MKKFYLLFALCLAMIANTLQVRADYYVVDGLDESSYPVVSTIETGKYYALGLARYIGDGEAHKYFSTSGLVTVLNGDDLWAFEAIGADGDGNTVYVLKQKSTGKYLQQGFGFVESPERAWPFTLRATEYVDNSGFDPDDESTAIDWTQYDARYAAADMSNDGNFGAVFNDEGEFAASFVLCAYPVNQENPTYLGYTAEGKPAFTNVRWANNWLVYPTKEASGREVLDLYLENHSFDPDSYEVGIDPGQCTQEALDAVASAWDEIEKLNAMDEPDAAAVAAAIEAYENAIVELGKSVKVFGYGYYMFQNYRDNGVMYGTPDLTTFYTPNYVAPENEEDWTLNDLRYVWEFVRIGDKDYLRNYVTNTYLGHPSKIYEELPMTKSPETNFNVEVNTGNEHGLSGWFNIIDLSIDEEDSKWQTNYGGWEAGVANCLHTQNNGHKIVYWSKGAGGSLWRVRTVPQTVIDSWLSRLDQEQMNEELKSLYDKANTTYEKAESECYESDATRDAEFASVGSGEYEADGLIKSVDQFRTNVGETNEGPATGLFDGDFSSYFHSNWSGSIDDVINFQVDLGEPLDLVTLKIASRSHQNNAEPLKMTVLGSNIEPTLFANAYDQGERGVDETEWTECGTLTMSYDWNFGAGGVNNVVGLGVAKLSAPYRYLRFNVTETRKPQQYFTMSELRAYKTVADFTKGNLSSMDPAVLKEFQDAMAAAKEAIANRNATRELIERLNAAYENFLNFYPEPQILRDLKAEAQDWLDNSVEGDEVGMYPASAIEALRTAIDKVVVEDVMTLEAINEGKAILTKALADFHAALIVPESGDYFVRCLAPSESVSHNGLMCTRRPGASELGWGGYDRESAVDVEYVGNLKDVRYLWHLTANEDHTFTLYNYGTGTYLAEVEEPGASVKVLSTVDPAKAKHFTFQSNRSAEYSALNIVMSENFYLNFQPGGNAIVLWNSARELDNSAIAFEAYSAESWENTQVQHFEKGVPQIVTYPYAVSLEYTFIPYYKLLGQDAEGNYRFAEYGGLCNGGSDVIPAGTPALIYVPEEYAIEESYDFVNVIGDGLKSLVYSRAASTYQNGMIGVLEDTELEQGCGLFYQYDLLQHISATVEGDVVSAGSGYFVVGTPTTEEGTLTIAGSSAITAEYEFVEGVSQTVVANGRTSRGTFNLMGQKVSGQLPAGLYIINSKKVVVK